MSTDAVGESVRSGIWRYITTPSPMHEGTRLIDLFIALPVMLCGFLVRVWWDTDWALAFFPLSVVAAVISRRLIPDAIGNET